MAISLPEGWRLVKLDTVDSTNAEAMRRAHMGERGPLWVWAGRQTSGRGRQGRAWLSEAGNLYCSALLDTDFEPQKLSQVGFVAGLAAYDAVRRSLKGSLQASRLSLKWPNDLLLNGSKVSGILLESSSRAERCGIVVVGVGVNVEHSPNLEEGTSYKATSLRETGVVVEVATVVEYLVHGFDHWYNAWDNGARFDVVREAWMERCHALGASVAVSAPQGTLRGRFARLDLDGAMVLETQSGDEHRVLAGDLIAPTVFSPGNEIMGS